MHERQTIQLADGLEELIDYRGKSPPKSKVGIPVISAKVVKNGRITQPIVQTIDPHYYPVWMTRGLPQVGDVVMTTEGPLGEVAQLDEETVTFALAQRVVCMRGKRGVLDSTFLKFLLMSPMQQSVLSAYATGTTVEGISQKALRSLPISIPSYTDQVIIGELLGAIDGKIDLTRRMNETLEAMARVFFKDWFVEFGPTRAKAEGHAPYLAPEIWTLFPDCLDDDDKPEGWSVSKIREVASVVQYGLTQSAKSSGPGPQFLRITDIQGGAVSWQSVPFCDASEKEEECYRLLNGDIVVARTGASTGENLYVVDPPRAVFASYLVRFQFPDPAVARIVAQYMRSTDYRSFVAGSIGGSAQPNASAQVLGSAPMVFPHMALAHAFLDCVSPLDRAKRHNERENQILAQTRDLLLPKLMSGEIRLREAEKIVEAVA